MENFFSENWMALIVALIGAAASLVVARHTAKTAANAEFEKLKREYLLEHQSESLVRMLLTQKKWSRRSFKAIQTKIGGFDDDILRQTLIRAGAIRLATSTDPSREFWGLIELNKGELGESVED